MSWITRLYLAALLATQAFAAQAVTGLKLVSTPGDYIGQGQTQTFRAPRSNVAVSGSSAHASVQVSDDSTGWTLDFAAPSGTTLALGSYPDAARYPFNSPLRAGLSVSGDGRGCNTLKGWFQVLDFATNASGSIVRLAIDFVQNCEVTMPPLYGSVRFNSSVPLEVPTLQAVAGADFSVTSGQNATLDGTQSFSRRRGRVAYQWTQLDGPNVALSNPTSVAPTFVAPGVGVDGSALHFRLDVADNAGHTSSDDVVVLVKSASAPTTQVSFHGDAGDYITGGRTYSYDLSNAQIAFSRNFGNGVSVSINGATWWNLDTATPNNGPYTPGTYQNAQRFPFQAANTPGLSLSGDGRGCNTLTGQFTVHQVQFDSGGTPQQLDVSFEQHCEGGSPAAYGQVLLNAVPHMQLAAELRSARLRYGARP